MDAVKPREVKMPTFFPYNGSKNPVEHVGLYQDWIIMHGTNEPLLCKGFPLSLSGVARAWYRMLGPSSISSFWQLTEKFLDKFTGSVTKKGKLYLKNEYCLEGLLDGDFLWYLTKHTTKMYTDLVDEINKKAALKEYKKSRWDKRDVEEGKSLAKRKRHEDSQPKAKKKPDTRTDSKFSCTREFKSFTPPHK
ncbi:hypothetical protein TorRG33x02_175540, partial [Trema orientale]